MIRLPISDEHDTAKIASAFAACAEPGDVALLEGNLGAGKTTFVRYFARALGVPEDEPVTSPSFAIVQEYEARIPLVHADLYRLAHADELTELGLEERIGRDAVVLIEWGDAHAHALGRVDLVIVIETRGDSRTFVLDARTPRGESIARELVTAHDGP